MHISQVLSTRIETCECLQGFTQLRVCSIEEIEADLCVIIEAAWKFIDGIELEFYEFVTDLHLILVYVAVAECEIMESVTIALH